MSQGKLVLKAEFKAIDLALFSHFVHLHIVFLEDREENGAEPFTCGAVYVKVTFEVQRKGASDILLLVEYNIANSSICAMQEKFSTHSISLIGHLFFI